MGLLLWLLGQAVVAEQIVQWLKLSPLIRRYPKVAAMILNLVAAIVIEAIGQGPLAQALDGFIQAVVAGLLAFAGSVATYEVLSKPAKGVTG